MTDIIPVVPYEDIRAAHDWLVKVLGFTAGGVYEDGNGDVIHGEVQLGDRRIWLHATRAGLSTPNQSKAETGGVTVLVPDVDAHYRQAKAAGGEILSEPTDQDYGQREYGVRDPEGHRWWMATPFTP